MDSPNRICEKCCKPIGSGETIIIQDKCYHKKCCECCVCNKVPPVLNIYHSQIYCTECLNKHVLENMCKGFKDAEDGTCVCNKCLEPILDPHDKIIVGNKCFHKKCCECCLCKKVPTVIRAHQCQIYCPECFSKRVMGQACNDQSDTTTTTSICQKCFEQIPHPLDGIVIGNKCYHRKCCECCICKKVSAAIMNHECKVYCQGCYDKHVLAKKSMGTGDSANCCVCEKCLEPILDPLDKIVVGNKCYHKKCCECCACKNLAAAPRAYLCQIYCQDCFNKLVLGQEWRSTQEHSHCFCDKCLALILDPADKIVIGNKCYHKKCCLCCVCKKVPSIIKVYQCRVFCPECFMKYMVGQGCRNKYRFWNNFSMPTSYQYAMARRLNDAARSGGRKRPVVVMANEAECDVKVDGVHRPGCSKFCFPHAPPQLFDDTKVDNKRKIVPKYHSICEDEDKIRKNITEKDNIDVKMSNKLKNINESDKKLFQNGVLTGNFEHFMGNSDGMPANNVGDDLKELEFLKRPSLSNPGWISWVEEQLNILEWAAMGRKVIVPKCLWQHNPFDIVS